MLGPATLDRYVAADRAYTAAVIARLKALASELLTSPDMKIALITDPAFAARMHAAYIAADGGKQASIEKLVFVAGVAQPRRQGKAVRSARRGGQPEVSTTGN